MKTIMIAGASSNSGKTTISLGMIRAFKNRGIKISPFKTGPDFLDTKYLAKAAKSTAGNLDIHLMGEEGLRDSMSMKIGDLAIVEGAMGYFDGLHNVYENSSYDIGRKLDIPAILVYSPGGEMFSAVTKIKGMAEFQDSKIRGVILNRVSKAMYELLKEQIEKYTDIEVLGYLPMDRDMEIEDEKLGLDLSKGDDFIDYMAEKIEETIDLDRILEISGKIELKSYIYPAKRNIRVAIAYDEAFNFYYRENINLLENICQVEYFSPLRDKKIPRADLIYIGGGYIEDYRQELSQNHEILEELKRRGENGQYILGESAGLIYLAESMEESKMVGLVKESAKTIDGLGRFGYVNIEIGEDCLLGKKYSILKGQEYHKTMIESQGREIFNILKPMSKGRWECGYKYKNVLGYFQHINFLGNMEAFNYLLDKIERKRGK